MIFVEAVEFSKKFPEFHPKIIKGTIFYDNWNNVKDDYVVVVDSELAVGQFSNEFENYLKSRKLTLDQIQNYLMVRTINSKQNYG
jgi:hypothetical protein